MQTPDRAGRFDIDAASSARGNRSWWDAEARDYLDEHGAFLGDAEFVWGPEGWREDDLHVLGEPSGLAGRDLLEFGAGAAQAGRWCARQAARVVATDLSGGMLRTAAQLDARTGTSLPLVQCDASRLPFADASFDVVFSAFGAVPFIADTEALMRELARVTRPGGLVAFSTTHPVRASREYRQQGRPRPGSASAVEDLLGLTGRQDRSRRGLGAKPLDGALQPSLHGNLR